ncbi:MAG: GC-type dockerin domain-anchored protein [Phycisphaerales bacterium]
MIDYSPAPGQNVNNPAYNDPARALSAPIGGGMLAADNSKVVTLGGWGGSITLGFDHPILNRPPTATNPRGCDFIVFGNAFLVGGDPDRRWAEPAMIEVSRDANGNDLADDEWFVIRGSHLPAAPAAAIVTATLHGSDFPAAWLPPGKDATSVWMVTTYRLDDVVFTAGAVLQNPLAGTGESGVWGYADCGPVLLTGDLDADDVIDNSAAAPEHFFTIPTDPMRTGISKFSGGGDAIDISWAVRNDGSPAGLTQIDFVRITTAVNVVRGALGEASSEISGVAEVLPRMLADVAAQGGTLGPDGVLTVDDIVVYLSLFFSGSNLADCAALGGGSEPDGVLTVDDLVAFLSGFFSGN